MGQIGIWFRNFARRIDQLPMVNVHPELLDWGGFVADSLRQGQLAVQAAAAGKARRPLGNRARTQSRRQGTMSAQALVRELESATLEIRRRMMEIFNAEF
jgi:hypothetical protein